MSFLKGLMVATLAFSSVEAYSCSIAEINDVEQKNELIAQAVTRAGVSLENMDEISSIKVSDYDAQYVYMGYCSVWVNAKATINLEYQKDDGICFSEYHIERKIIDNKIQYFDVKELVPTLCSQG